MKAEVVILVTDADLADPTSQSEALVKARVAVNRLGIPDDGEVTPSLFGDGFRCVFAVNDLTLTA